MKTIGNYLDIINLSPEIVADELVVRRQHHSTRAPVFRKMQQQQQSNDAEFLAAMANTSANQQSTYENSADLNTSQVEQKSHTDIITSSRTRIRTYTQRESTMPLISHQNRESEISNNDWHQLNQRAGNFSSESIAQVPDISTPKKGKKRGGCVLFCCCDGRKREGFWCFLLLVILLMLLVCGIIYYFLFYGAVKIVETTTMLASTASTTTLLASSTALPTTTVESTTVTIPTSLAETTVRNTTVEMSTTEVQTQTSPEVTTQVGTTTVPVTTSRVNTTQAATEPITVAPSTRLTTESSTVLILTTTFASTTQFVPTTESATTTTSNHENCNYSIFFMVESCDDYNSEIYQNSLSKIDQIRGALPKSDRVKVQVTQFCETSSSDLENQLGGKSGNLLSNVAFVRDQFNPASANIIFILTAGHQKNKLSTADYLIKDIKHNMQGKFMTLAVRSDRGVNLQEVAGIASENADGSGKYLFEMTTSEHEIAKQIEAGFCQEVSPFDPLPVYPCDLCQNADLLTYASWTQSLKET